MSSVGQRLASGPTSSADAQRAEGERKGLGAHGPFALLALRALRAGVLDAMRLLEPVVVAVERHAPHARDLGPAEIAAKSPVRAGLGRFAHSRRIPSGP